MRKNRLSIDWTASNVLSLVNDEIQNSPNNLARAFESIAGKMDTTPSNVAKAWYRSLKFNIKGFTVTSKNVRVINTKNDRRVKSEVLPIHETVVSTQKFDGMRVVTIKKYFVD